VRAPIEDAWKQLEQLFHEAVALSPDSRAEFLENACPDERLRAELWSLLTMATSADSFLEDSLIRSLHVPALAAGSRLAGFEVVELVGWGGMGEVYRARDLRLNREVALKVLPKALASDHAGIARLQQEARVLAALNHPNIAGIYEFVEDSGCFAVVLEFVGRDIKRAAGARHAFTGGRLGDFETNRARARGCAQ
jgi:serine/threonine protein kinase